jgi:hypothetical protein
LKPLAKAAFFIPSIGSIFEPYPHKFTIKTACMQKILIGTLAGLVAGVAVGLLLAPVSGSDTRSSIASGTKRQWRKLWGKQDLDEDPWLEYNEKRAAVSENA